VAALAWPSMATAQQPIEAVGSQQRLTTQGAANNAGVDTSSVDVAYNGVRNEYLIVWANSNAGVAPTDTEIFGRRLNGNGAPIGAAFQISGLAPADPDFDASDPSVAYDPERNRYAVAFLRELTAAGSKEITIQIVNATGQLTGFDGTVGAAPVTGSIFGITGGERTATNATDIVYRPDASGDDTPGDAYIAAYAGDLADNNRFDILLSSWPAEDGSPVVLMRRASNMTDNGDGFDPSLVSVSSSDDVVVAWEGATAGQGADSEIFINRVPGSLPNDDDQVQISTTAPGDTANDSSDPSVAVNPGFPQFLVAFQSQRSTTEGPEIRIQRVDAGMGEIAPDDQLVSSAGPPGSGTPFSAGAPAVAWHSGLDRYLVTWIGEDNSRPGYADDEIEVTGTVLSATGVEANPQDFPISRMGVINDDSAVPSSNALAANAGQWLSVWTSDEPQVTTADNEFEVFGRQVGPNFDRDFDGSPVPEDCNDGNPGIRPGAVDVLDNGIDEDCAGGDAQNPDRDGDGSPRPADCNDGNPFVRPGAAEVPANGVDEDCAGGDTPLPPKRITGVTLSFDHEIFTRFTRLPRLQVKGVPGGSTVRATCAVKKRKCPGRARKAFTKRGARGTVSLNSRYKGVKLPAGTKITVTVTKPGFIGAAKIFEVRRGPKRPKVTDRCLLPGTTRLRQRC
jgi:Putative metal-binding motif